MRVGLRKKWVISITIVIILLSSALSFFFIRKLNADQKEHLISQGLTLADNLAYNSEYGVLIANEEMLSKLLQGVMREKDVEYCMIQDLQGGVLSSTGVMQRDVVIEGFLNSQALKTPKPLVQFYASGRGVGIYDITVPIMVRAKEAPLGELEFFITSEENRLEIPTKIGIARVGISLASVNLHMAKVQRTAIITTLGIILIAVFVTYFMVGAIVTPVHRLVRGTQRLAKGDLDYRVPITTNDEIGDLGNAFNKMTGDLKASRDELLKAKDYTDNIIISMIDSLIVLDPQAKIVRVNPATVELLGYREDELIGKAVSTIFFEGQTPLEGHRLTMLLKEGKLGDYETYYKAKDRKKIPVLFSASAMKDKDGRIVFVVCTARDITSRKEAEQVLKRAYTELKETQEQLVQAERLEIAGRLASGVAHEVKNPLAIILQCADYLIKKVKTDDENISLTLSHIKDAVERADNVTRGLLDFSSLTELNMTCCDLNPIVERVLFLMKHQFDKYHIQVTKRLDTEIVPITIDKDRIEQVLVNLFMNSVAAMPEGGELTVKSYMVQPQGEEKSVIFQIEDTGGGIPEEILGKIFDPFFSTRREVGGTGLGLSVVRNIVELHNGRISIQNKEDRGVRVTLIFMA